MQISFSKTKSSIFKDAHSNKTNKGTTFRLTEVSLWQLVLDVSVIQEKNCLWGAVMKGAEGGDAVSVFTGPEPAC